MEWILIVAIDRRQHLRSRDQQTDGIVGCGNAWEIIFLERAAISTTILATWYVSAREGLWGKK